MFEVYDFIFFLPETIQIRKFAENFRHVNIGTINLVFLR